MLILKAIVISVLVVIGILLIAFHKWFFDNIKRVREHRLKDEPRLIGVDVIV